MDPDQRGALAIQSIKLQVGVMIMVIMCGYGVMIAAAARQVSGRNILNAGGREYYRDQGVIKGNNMMISGWSMIDMVSNASALVIFGDSIVDAGNNNHLDTLARVDHPPYGIDYPHHLPTGRWSDGLIIPDYLAQSLGFPSPLPYLDPNATGLAIITGINFASGASGVLNSTKFTLGVIPLERQLEWYRNYRDKLSEMLGDEATSALLSNALHVICSGTNDYLRGYYQNLSISKNISEFRASLLQSYEDNLKTLYDVGGRIVAIVGIPPMGCIPLVTQGSTSCSDEMNSEAQEFNKELQVLLSMLPSRSGFEDFKFLYIDSYDPAMDILQHPSQYGFTETAKGCCGDGINAIGPLCFFLSCNNISEYFFFDGVHPTQRVYEIIVKQLF